MNLRSKIAIIIMGFFLLYGVVDYGIQRFIIFPSFLSLEQEDAIRNSTRVDQAINREIHLLDVLAHDWAAWNDTYEFAESFSDDYLESNIIDSFTDSLNLIYICDKNGKVIWGEIHDPKTESKLFIDNIPKNRLPKTHPLISYTAENKPLSDVSVTGVYITQKGPMIIASRPILNSMSEGPSRGSLILGRFLTEQIVKDIAKQTQVDVQIFPFQKNPIPENLRGTFTQLTDNSPYLIETDKDDDQKHIYTAYPDIEGNSALLIKSKIPRDILVKGFSTMHYAMLSVLVAGLGMLIVFLLVLKWVILKPISRLTNHAMEVRKTSNLPKRLSSQSQDEISILSDEFDDLLIQLENRSATLEDLNAELQEDIEKRKQAEEELRKNEEKLVRLKKMEALGLLAGGVAHDLNNVLSGIVSYPELILMDLPEDSKLRKPIETMLETGNRATAIVKDLLTVARGVATTKDPLNLNDIINSYLNSPEFKKLEDFHPRVSIKNNLDTELLNIIGSNIHIRKVVMNLVSNASEAVEESGNVTISTTNRYIDKPLRGYDDVTIGEYAVFTVSDNGSGISSDDLERIFEPFYTKKVMGRSGTGLGLAVVWNIVQDHKGYIDVKSRNNGTTFELYFPITREEISDNKLTIPIKDYKGNGETILVVDDVKSQRDISCKMLNRLGYKTNAVSSGEEAVEFLKEQTIDLLLLDMIMDPGINGRETYEKIIKIHPKQRAVIASGFAETDEVQKVQALGAGSFIKKPITLEKIGLAVKEELEKL